MLATKFIKPNSFKKKFILFSALFLIATIIASILATGNSFALAPKTLNTLSELDSQEPDIDGSARIASSYTLLSKTKYSPDFNIFNYNHYQLKVLNQNDIMNDSILIEMTTKSEPYSTQGDSNLNHKLPWWSSQAPDEIKTLDFSMVDGKLNEYFIGKHYKLTLLPNQGHWGKVYILENLSQKTGNTNKKLYTVKLLLTRTDRNMSVKAFHERHQKEIVNNFLLDDLNLNLAIQPYGIVQNDADHYLLFMEYAQGIQDYFKEQSRSKKINHIYHFLHNLNQFHTAGFVHGDLKIDNMLFKDNKIKLCDWFSFSEYPKLATNEYRYIGDNLPPEAIRAFYFDKVLHLKDNLEYAAIKDPETTVLMLHPVAADRYCLGISLFEMLEPELYQKISQKYLGLMPKNFNPYKPDSLDFWEIQRSFIHEAQTQLLDKAYQVQDKRESDLLKQISQFIDLNPMKRQYVLND